MQGEKKKKIIWFFLILLFFNSFLFSSKSVVEAGIYELATQKFSPLHSPSYFGSITDSFLNPATLPLIEDSSTFALGLSVSDKLNLEIAYGENMGYIQDQVQEIRLSFFSKYISLSALLGTSFTGRRFEGMNIFPNFDVYSNIDISIDAGYAFPFFAFGFNIRGGNSMIRSGKIMDSFSDIFANAWFSNFQIAYQSERFGLGAGLLFYLPNFSISVNVEELLNIKNEKVNTSWSDIANTSTVSASFIGNKFTKRGDLNLVNYQASISYLGFSNSPYVNYLMLKGGLIFQFLPKASLVLGLGYYEKNHHFFDFDLNKGEFALSLFGEWESVSVEVGFTLDTASFNMIKPTFLLIYAN